MRLSALLNPQAVALSFQAGSKDEAIERLVALLEQAHGFETGGDLLARVRKREAVMSTAIGGGVAIPHGKSAVIDRMAAACAVSPEGMDFDSEDGLPVHLFVLFVSPEGHATQHVRVLGNISRLLKEEAVRRELRSAATPEAFLETIRTAEQAHVPADHE